jgi:hypothetical protein
VPFTFAHAAAALPFRRSGLVPSAVVIGCFAPDFEYFVRLAPRGSFGHSWLGLLLLDLPLGVAVFWLFHRYAKEPLWVWLPASARQKIRFDPQMPRLTSVAQIALVLVSILVGAATHLIWDSFTHATYWPYRHWHFMSYMIWLPLAGPVPYYKLLQHASTALGLAVLSSWFLLLPKSAPAPLRLVWNARVNERAVLAFAAAIALAGAAVRTCVALGMPAGLHAVETFAAEAVITAITLFWVEVVLYGFIRDRAGSQRETAGAGARAL